MFASVQSLAQISLDDIKADAYDVVVVDEFHRAAATTYERLLDHLKPKVLLGLTATPERTDGTSVLRWFDNRIAVELRLWDALERGLLCPFQYFGISDGVDLSQVEWSRGGYVQSALERIYTGDQRRVDLVVAALKQKLADPREMRALGFCVSVAHAEFMASEFSRRGIPAVAVSARFVKLDFAKRDAENRRLGRLGEEWVMEFEHRRLFDEAQRPELARRSNGLPIRGGMARATTLLRSTLTRRSPRFIESRQRDWESIFRLWSLPMRSRVRT